MGSRWLERHGAVVVAVLGGLLAVALVLIGVLFARLEQTREDLQRVESGAALSMLQVQGFREQLEVVGPDVAVGLDLAIEGLEAFGDSTLEFEFAIDEALPVDAEIEFAREFVIPIEATIPIEQTVETTIEVRGPLGIAVPVDVAVPIDLDVPVALELTFSVDETVPVRAEVPVHLDVPIEIAVGDTELARLADALAAGLASFRELFAGIASE